ncbi:putative methyl-accepting chemotaxis protein [Vibrio nigripulchritudo MADA3029]|uniref:Methyl-accepting chemotaxis protein n=2 Tax=Vibrio nigripulchritudo TaxID=28173 RepID=A0AAV2VRH9_9VIBR|nr:methyl-accepting chemotaxis protein [Vibrio nigripulchritudo]EGU60930.1 Methyl-accepting chemotaxis protein [Vibrio nigripulchritudo ATCC 27043]KJY75083.1 chemotaxis protein [Vibrio nigripulchritudo]CCN46280.1 putative methyl-accepting chemotaxis protein [Vibrio nigripulchritudo MADA3020]CCN52654.1 putative methyl-accepting chemotaxis protein [Vibrio nigripulchritudo MADA3021]CCN59062.1 putative methyl-accepting chemotaxis protein [Vibrio nigripulchritudo MADA3029]
MIGSLSMSIKQKIVIGMAFAVLASTSIVGFMAQNQARDVLEHRLVQIELPSMLNLVSSEVDQEVSQLLNAAEQIANNTFIQQAVSTTDRDPATEKMLVEQLNNVRAQYNLNDASVANRESAYYWNQNGFLRQLNRQQDGWFFGFTSSGQETMVSVFTEANGEVKMFANYQITSGKTMSGLSKSLNDMVSLLNSFQIEQSGFVFLTDSQGKVQIHKQSSKTNTNLSGIYGSEASQLLNKSGYNIVRSQYDGVDVFVVSQYVPSMDWFIVAQVPVDEVFAELDSTAQKMMITTLVVALIFVALSLILAGSITKPINVIAERFRQLGEGDGDLAQRIEINGKDEIAKLSQGFNGFIEKIHNSVKEVAETSNALQIAAEGVAEKSHITHDNSQNQRDQTIQVVTAINEMGATISEIASNAATAAETASGAESNTEDGRGVVFRAKDAISRLASDIEHIGGVVQKLAGTTQDIGSILDVIRDISEQTNLLALNAAIEAARAGEQGRGFAVVADEVRNLASRTADSTEEIQKMINQLQADAQDAVSAMEAGQAVTMEGVESTDQAVEVLGLISESISDISDRNTQVATATEEQSTVVHTINENIEEINSINELTTNTAQELADASAELQSLSKRLDAMVGNFKL